MYRVVSFAFIACLALMIGCGFHLRGAIVIPEEFKTISISPDNPHEELQRSIRRILKKKGVTIVATTAKNVPKLDVSKPVFSEQVLALANNNLPVRLKLQISFTYSVYDKNNKIIQGPKNIVSSKDFSVDPNNILSADSQRVIIKRELFQEAVSRLMRQIQKAYNKQHANLEAE